MVETEHDRVRAEARQTAEAVRAACLEAARTGYESAAMAGLCHEGAMEASLDAIVRLDLDELLARLPDR